MAMPGHVWRDGPQELESLASQLAADGGHSRDVTARLLQAGGDPDRHRIRPGSRHDGDGRGGPLRRRRGVLPSRDDQVHLEGNELGGKLRESIVFALGSALLKADVLPLHVAELAHLLAERNPPSLAAGIGRAVVEESDPVHLPHLLRLGSKRRGKEAASKHRHEPSAL